MRLLFAALADDIEYGGELVGYTAWGLTYFFKVDSQPRQHVFTLQMIVRTEITDHVEPLDLSLSLIQGESTHLTTVLMPFEFPEAFLDKPVQHLFFETRGTFETPDNYRFDIFQGKRKIGSIPFEVVRVPDGEKLYEHNRDFDICEFVEAPPAG